MKIIFNDASELQIQSATLDSGALKIKVLKTIASQDSLNEILSNPEKTKRIIVHENGKKVAEYENYTQLDGIMAYTAGILEPVLYKAGETMEEIISRLQEDNEKLKQENTKKDEKIDMLIQCMLEMSEMVYQ